MQQASNQPRKHPRRDLTLTESTGMLIDAAVERRRRDSQKHRAAQLDTALSELERLRREVDVHHSDLSRQRRRSRIAIGFGACALALASGFGLGQWLWSDTSPTTTTEVP